MPWMLIWTLLWPSLVSTLLAVVSWLMFRRRSHTILAGRARVAAIAGIAAIVAAAYPLLSAVPLWIEVPEGMWSALSGARFTLPLLLGLLTMVLLGALRRRPTTPSGALLAPRTWRSFLSTWWFVALMGVLALILGLTLAAGVASQPNEAGEYVLYWVDLGAGAIGTTIYGWHHSLVPAALCALLSAATWWTLTRIARPPLESPHIMDVAARRLDSANAARVALGALLLHLEAILRSLANTSRVTGSFSAPDAMPFSAGTPFSALTGALDVLALLAGILGLALWVFTALTALPAPTPSRSSRASVHS
ncbi:hypothetical protein [Brachybacterium sp. YJGR34]|uniref:hypothetical protein n=1 Tax=Brachybacterium sp. YJGR34 TaxID=2059911 RepID=UPI000E0A7CC6|nr:hypothetical protein [Brachybacterium sp. YJGR34]